MSRVATSGRRMSHGLGRWVMIRALTSCRPAALPTGSTCAVCRRCYGRMWSRASGGGEPRSLGRAARAPATRGRRPLAAIAEPLGEDRIALCRPGPRSRRRLCSAPGARVAGSSSARRSEGAAATRCGPQQRTGATAGPSIWARLSLMPLGEDQREVDRLPTSSAAAITTEASWPIRLLGRNRLTAS